MSDIYSTAIAVSTTDVGSDSRAYDIDLTGNSVAAKSSFERSRKEKNPNCAGNGNPFQSARRLVKSRDAKFFKQPNETC